MDKLLFPMWWVLFPIFLFLVMILDIKSLLRLSQRRQTYTEEHEPTKMNSRKDALLVKGPNVKNIEGPMSTKRPDLQTGPMGPGELRRGLKNSIPVSKTEYRALLQVSWLVSTTTCNQFYTLALDSSYHDPGIWKTFPPQIIRSSCTLHPKQITPLPLN